MHARRPATVLVRGALCAALLAALFGASRAATAQERRASPSQRDPAVFTREVVLDAELEAALHLNFLVSGPLVDARTGAACRVASVLGFTTVRGALQLDLAHLSPSLAATGAEPIAFRVGYEHEGASGDFEVRLAPPAGKSWGELRDARDLSIATTRE